MNDLLWGPFWFTCSSGGDLLHYPPWVYPIRHFGHMFSVLKNSRKTDQAGISSFRALCTSLAARWYWKHGRGCRCPLTVGGPGAIFWMWLIAMLGMATSFAESTLAQFYKTKDDDGNYRGGLLTTWKKALGMRWMGVLFSVFLIIALVGVPTRASQLNSPVRTKRLRLGRPTLAARSWCWRA